MSILVVDKKIEDKSISDYETLKKAKISYEGINDILKFSNIRMDTETVKELDNAVNIANTLSKVYAQKRRTLKISGVIGDLRVRAGCSIGVRLNLGDIITNKLFFVERVVHHFEHDRHYMDLDFYDSGVWRIDDSTTGTWQEVKNG